MVSIIPDQRPKGCDLVFVVYFIFVLYIEFKLTSAVPLYKLQQGLHCFGYYFACCSSLVIMATSKLKVLLLGHSFVRRFMVFCSVENCPPNFGLSEIYLFFQGTGGRTVPTLLNYDTHAVAQVQPDILILEIGTNDLCNPSLHPATVGSAIDEACGFFISRFGVKHIVVSQILHRNSPPFPDFNARVDALNTYLQVVLNDRNSVTFWTHRGMLYPEIPILLSDGVHLNDAGNRRLFRSYRGSIMYVLGVFFS